MHPVPHKRPCPRASVLTLAALAMLTTSKRAVGDCIDYGTNPQSPPIVGSVETYPSDGMTISGTHVYMCVTGPELSSRMLVADIADPQHPQIVGSVSTPGGALNVALSGEYAYVADGPFGLEVINISNPQHPQVVGSASREGFASDVAVSGNHAYVTDFNFGLEVFDVTSPQNPQFAGCVHISDYVYGVEVSGRYAYIADGSAGLQVIDISDPQLPQVAGSVQIPLSHQVAVSGSFAYVISSLGVSVVDVRNPQIPAGIYFVKLDTERNSRIQRLAVVL